MSASEKNIVLVGFMGAGKSVTAKELAKRLKRKVISTDEVIERREGRRITDIFKTYGEKYFRQKEHDAVVELTENQGLIIDCGGGAFLNDENRALLKKTGITIYLSASPQVLHERTHHRTHRPLLNVENPLVKIEELLQARKSFYEQADHTIVTDTKTNAEVCDEIVKLLS